MGYSVVLVDDDKVTLRLLEHMLEKAGFEIFTSCDGSKAWKLIQEKSPHIVISDILIPQLDGFALTKKIKQDPQLKNVKVILMSAVYKDQKFRADIREAGADYFIVKPVDTKDLLVILKKILTS